MISFFALIYQQVLVAATYNTCISRNSGNAVVSTNTGEEEAGQGKKNVVQIHNATENLKFLNRALTRNPVHPLIECTVKQVNEVKTVLKILPIFMSTIMLNCCLAQISTFSLFHGLP